MKIVVILPTYNERENIKEMIPLLEKEIFPRIKNHEMYILVVDDKSPDGTADQVKSYMKNWKNIELLSGDKKGLGAAYVRGMKYAMEKMKADAVMEFDSDFQHDPRDIPRLIKAMEEGAGHVIGSRYVKGGSIPSEWGIDRKFLSIFGSLFTRIVWLNFKIHDMTSGFKLTKTDILKKVDIDHLLSHNFAYKMHILHDIVKTGTKVTEVPIAFLEREKGDSKISKKDQFESLYVVLRLAIYDHKRFVKFLIVGGTGFVIQYVVLYISVYSGLAQYVGAALSAEAAILSNFFLNNLWTFKDTKEIKEKGNIFVRLIKFNSASMGAIGIQALAIYIAVELLGEKISVFGTQIHTSFIVLFPTIVLLVIPLNYLIYNKLIWKTQYLKKAK